MMNAYNYQNTEQPQPTNRELLASLSEFGYRITQHSELMLAEVTELARKNEQLSRNKKRIRTAERLVVAKGQPLGVEYLYDNGHREIKDLAENITGGYRIFNLDFGGREEGLRFGILFEEEMVFVTGEKKKVRGSYLYECFVRAGVAFNLHISQSVIKKILFEYWGSVIDNAESSMRIPALAGWFNGEFWHKGDFPYKRTADFPDLPILHKDLKYVEMEESHRQAYFREICKIQRWQDRLIITSCPFWGLLSSLLGRDKAAKYCLNFVLLKEFNVDMVCSWFQIYNREHLMPFSLDVTAKGLERILEDAQDEVLVFNAAIDESETDYLKKKSFRHILKIANANSAQSDSGIRPQNAYAFISKNIISRRNFLNIIVDSDFYDFNEDSQQFDEMQNEAVFYSFVRFVQNHMDEVRQIIRKKRVGIPRTMQTFAIIHDILTMFWDEEGIDFDEVLHLPADWSFWDIEQFYFEGEMEGYVPALIKAVRSRIGNYFMKEKHYGGQYAEGMVFYDDRFFFFPTVVFDEILSDCGLKNQKSQILLELQKDEKLKRDEDSVAKALQIGGKRFEAYVVCREVFETVGKPSLISLSREGE